MIGLLTFLATFLPKLSKSVDVDQSYNKPFLSVVMMHVWHY